MSVALLSNATYYTHFFEYPIKIAFEHLLPTYRNTF